MNLTRGLFRLWIVATILWFVVLLALTSPYSHALKLWELRNVSAPPGADRRGAEFEVIGPLGESFGTIGEIEEQLQSAIEKNESQEIARLAILMSEGLSQFKNGAESTAQTILDPASLYIFRLKYPEYDDLSDRDLAERLYLRFYSNMNRAEYFKRLGLEGQTDEPKGYETVRRVMSERAVKDPQTIRDLELGPPSWKTQIEERSEMKKRLAEFVQSALIPPFAILLIGSAFVWALRGFRAN